MDHYAHAIKLSYTTGGESTTEASPYELFPANAKLPQRMSVEVPGVDEDVVVFLTEAAKPPPPSEKKSSEEEKKDSAEKRSSKKNNKPTALLAGGGSRLPANVGSTRSGVDPVPFAAYRIGGVDAAIKLLVKDLRAQREKRAKRRRAAKASGKGTSTDADRAREEADARPLPKSVGVGLHFVLDRSGILALERVTVGGDRAGTIENDATRDGRETDHRRRRV